MTRNKKVASVGAVAIAISMTFSGCKTVPQQTANTQKPSADSAYSSAGTNKNLTQLTPAEKQMREDETKFNSTVFGGVVMGAAIGAIGGAVIAKASGGDASTVRKSALGGAVAGGIIGGADGYATAKKQQAGNNEVRAMQSAVKDLQQDNKRLEQLIASSNTVLRDGQARLDALKVDIAAGKISAKEAEDARKREESNIAVMQNSLKKAKETRDQYASAGEKISKSEKNRSDLDSEIKRTDSQIAQLERNIADYSRAIAVSRA